MKLLLTSGGVTNISIREALVDLLGKPIADSNALCIPTAQYGHPWVGPGEEAWRFISGNSENPMVDLGWKSMGVLELTALPSLDQERWVPLVRETDALLVAGGDVLYLCHWMRQSGLADLLPALDETVWVGLSAGSMVLTPEVGEDFIQWRPPNGDDSTLGIVDFSICPHLGPGQHTGQLHGRGGAMGRRHLRPRLRHRRPDGHQGDRRRRRGGVRGALEAIALIAAVTSERRAETSAHARSALDQLGLQRRSLFALGAPGDAHPVRFAPTSEPMPTSALRRRRARRNRNVYDQ